MRWLCLLLAGCVNFAPIRQHVVSAEGITGSTGATGPSGETGGTGNSCTPRSCADQPAGYCGTTSDGCSGSILCACVAPMTCGGAGVSERCGVPTSVTGVSASPAAIVPQGLGASPRSQAVRLTVSGSGLGLVTTASLGGLAGSIDPSRTDTSLAIDFFVPHGATVGPRDLVLSGAGGMVTSTAAVTVTPLKVAVDGSNAALGSTAAPFQTIAQALQMASTGDTVLVAPTGVHSAGVFPTLGGATCNSTGTANIPAGVTVRGDGAMATIDGTGSTAKAAFITTNGASIADVTVTGFQSGIVAVDGAIVLDHVTASANTNCGIEVLSTGTAVLTNIVASNNGVGLSVNKTGGAISVGTITATGNTSGGIVLMGSFDATLSRVTASTNNPGNINGNGVLAVMTGMLTISGLVADGNQNGLNLNGNTLATIDFAQPSAGGAFVTGGVRYNTYDGVFVADNAAVSLRGATGPTDGGRTPILGRQVMGGGGFAGIEAVGTSHVTAMDLNVAEFTNRGVMVGVNTGTLSATTFEMYRSHVHSTAAPWCVLSVSAATVTLDATKVDQCTQYGVFVRGDGVGMPGPLNIVNQSEVSGIGDVGILVDTPGPGSVMPITITDATFVDDTNRAVVVAVPARTTIRTSTFSRQAATNTYAHIGVVGDNNLVDMGNVSGAGGNAFICGGGYILHDTRSTSATGQHTIRGGVYSDSGACSGSCTVDAFNTANPFCFQADQAPFVAYDNDPGSAGACTARGLQKL